MKMKQKQQIATLRGRGDSYMKIATALGIPVNTVQSYCRRNGLGACCAIPRPEASDVANVCPNCGRLLIHTPGSKRRVASITIPDDGVLVFTFKDGTERTLTWAPPSRRESWTDEMRAAARENFMKGEQHG